MHRSLALLLVLLFPPPLLAQDPPVLNGTAMQGVVLDATSYQPLTGARVEVVGTDAVAITDSRGGFLLTPLAEGEHTLRVVHPEYEEHEKSFRPAADGLLVVRMTRRTGALAESARADQGGFTLPGVVLDYLSGAPIPGAAVVVKESGLRAFTDEEGRFAIRNLPAGSHTIITTRLGYAEHSEESELRPGAFLQVALYPNPVVLEGITALGDMFQRRRLTVGYQSYAGDRGDLLSSTAPTLIDFISDRFRVNRQPCPGDAAGESFCMTVRGYPSSMAVFVDGHRLPGGVSALEQFSPADIYHIELYPILGQVHVFTPHYVDWLARSGRSLPPICIVCG